MIALSKCEGSKFIKYCEWLETNNAGYIILDFETNNFEDIKKCNKLLLTGGVDVSPELYGEYRDTNNIYNDKRDSFELKLIRYARENKFPILGICRGMQILNVAMGGSLVQDIQKEFGKEIDHKKRPDNTDKLHEIMLEKGSLIQEITCEDKGIVNSSHHQCVRNLGKGLKITSYSDKLIPESMEWKDRDEKPVILCVQWHPERMDEPCSNFSKNIIDWFKNI